MPLIGLPFIWGMRGGAIPIPVVPPSFISSSSAIAVTADPFNVSRPASTQIDDFLVAYVTSAEGLGGGQDVSMSGGTGGWTQRHENGVSVAGAFWIQAVFTRHVQASEPGTYSVDCGVVLAAGSAVGILAYRGVNTTTPVDVVGTALGPQNDDSSLTIPGVTTTVEGCMLLAMAARGNNSAFSANPGGMTQRLEVQQTGGSFDENHDQRYCEEELGAPAATGTREYTVGGTNPSMGVLMALRPV